MAFERQAAQNNPSTFSEFLFARKRLAVLHGNTLNWFKSYFTNRKQMCKVNETTSKCRTVSCGVPQGSNFGQYYFCYT
jgi:hypothetical protein